MLGKGKMEVAENSKKNIAHCARPQNSPSGIRSQDSRVTTNFIHGDKAPSSKAVNEVGISFNGNPCEKMSREVTTANCEIQTMTNKHREYCEADGVPFEEARMYMISFSALSRI